ncbi:MAG: hypothetical protein AB8W37_11725 [Arsenophonus endosymbiont of Dermacentor nuttalli]
MISKFIPNINENCLGNVIAKILNNDFIIYHKIISTIIFNKLITLYRFLYALLVLALNDRFDLSKNIFHDRYGIATNFSELALFCLSLAKEK